MEHVYSVSQVNSYIKNMFVRDYVLGNIAIKGEVSNCKYHTSGHIYFTLKDSMGQMACVMFAGQRSGLSFRMSEGQSVVAFGSINVYERDGKYQLYAKEIILDGSGLLYQRFEQMKLQLEKEGLFDREYKKEIPFYSKKIGIVTAKTGAALQDIINIATRRNPYAQLYLYPALVQGEGAKESIVRGIKYLDKLELDVMIVGRGGGSVEDLWAFNEEIVARAIFEAKTPIISAVGHETDVTIADFVSDLRAPTPSAAAELAVCNIRDVLLRCDELEFTLKQAMTRKIALYRNNLDKLSLRLSHVSPIYQLRERRQQLVDLEDKLGSLIKQRLQDKRHQLAIYIEKMNGLSPINKLNQGYSYVTNEESQNLRSISQIKVQEKIQIAVTDGDVIARVEEINPRRRV